MTKPVELGNLEPPASANHLLSPFFPSKFGGRPAWLSLNNIPSADRLRCTSCHQVMVFLLQIYAPADNKESTFHRTIFVFVCRNNACWTPNALNGNVRIFRSQLARKNDFYNFEPVHPGTPDGDTAIAELCRVSNKLCAVCGILAPQMCGKCKSINYCSREHQKLHWCAGHSQACSKQNETAAVECSLLFTELEIVTVVERFVDKSKPERPSEQRMEEYHKYVERVSAGTKQAYSVEELESMSKEVDKDFKKFRRRLEHNPYQVIRYHLNGEPLLAGKPPAMEIPTCSQCGSSRIFEFQIMPHLLNYMGVDELSTNSIDWATICIYTCSVNCEVAVNDYSEEYAWKQDYSG